LSYGNRKGLPDRTPLTALDPLLPVGHCRILQR